MLQLRKSGLGGCTCIIQRHADSAHAHPIWSSNAQLDQVGVWGDLSPFRRLLRFWISMTTKCPNLCCVGADERVLIHLDPELRETQPDYQPLLAKSTLRPADGSRIEDVVAKV